MGRCSTSEVPPDWVKQEERSDTLLESEEGHRISKVMAFIL
jgi:hypothetical protein